MVYQADTEFVGGAFEAQGDRHDEECVVEVVHRFERVAAESPSVRHTDDCSIWVAPGRVTLITEGLFPRSAIETFSC